MNPINMISLLLDGTQVLFEHIKVIAVLSVNILGIGAWVLMGISPDRAKREWNKSGTALLSMGICGFVLLSYAIIAVSRIWYSALPVLSNGLLIFSLLGLGTGFLFLLKKKTFPFDSAISFSRW